VRRTRFDDWDCSIARGTDLLGDWWTPMVLREAFLGARRFDQFAEGLGIPRNVLAERLARLVEEGILTREQYEERPPRFEYRLTEKGLGLYGVLVTLMHWGNTYLDWPEGPPVALVDRETGERIEPVLVDARTGERLDPRRTRVQRIRPGTSGPPTGAGASRG
jgi:DNA-binding HxlR family transcriptional regulator